MGEHPNHIDPRPKRRKDQANPYHIFTVGIESADPHFYLSFIDSQGVKICMEINRELFSQLNQFELEDLSYLNQIDNHYEHSELTEATLERRMAHYQESLEERAIRMDCYERLHAAIEKLPEGQRRRLRLYYFGGLTYEEIAKIDGCSFQAVAKSIAAGERRLAMILDEE